MEALMLKVLEFFVTSEIAGAWLLVILLFSVILYFKKIKPYINDFNSLSENVKKGTKSHEEIKALLREINELKRENIKEVNSRLDILSKKLEKLDLLIENTPNKTGIMIGKNMEDIQNEIVVFHNMFKDLNSLLNSHDIRSNEKLQEMILELTKIATRIETSFQVNSLRGIQK